MSVPNTSEKSFRVAIDIGGTFTDVVLSDENGLVGSAKVLSTPENYSHGPLNGLNRLKELYGHLGFEESRIVEISHGTTVATNALLENQGARTAVVTTKGFRDVLELRRLRIPYLYNLEYTPPEPMVPRHLRFEINERMDAQGQVHVPLDMDSVEKVAIELEAQNVEAVAICLLHAYANPLHELQTAEILAERLPNVYISTSSDVLPEIREYERTSTTVVNSYVGPVVKKYLESLRSGLTARQVDAPLLIMESNGGVMSDDLAIEKPAQIVESGPAAGVIGAQAVGLHSGYPNVISFDMGGTTAKASLIDQGAVSRTTEYEVGANMNHSTPFVMGSGYALKLPMIDIAEVGSGGGSIASISRSGTIKVGPRSAGSSPGPVCYGFGGTQPTVTDANVALGFLNPHSLANGTLPIDRPGAVESIDRVIAQPLGISVDEAAYGIYAVANANMIGAIKSVSTNRGRDPRDFALIAFGGNGAVHASMIAREIGIGRVIVPYGTGVLSAVGLLEADIEHHFVRTFIRGISTVELSAVHTVLDDLYRKAADAIGRELTGRDEVSNTEYEYLADMRYTGQAHELTVAFAGYPKSPRDVANLAETFGSEHERVHGYRSDDSPVEFFNLRVIARVELAKSSVIGAPPAPPIVDRTTRRVYLGPTIGAQEVPVLQRCHLSTEPVIGPVIIEEPDSTVVASVGDKVALDGTGNIVIEIALTTPPHAKGQ